MKYLKYFLIVGIVFFVASSYTARSSRLSEDIYPGNLMPDLKLKNKDGKDLDLKQLLGAKKVLVNFWAAYDAESRMNNVLLWNTVKQEKYPLTMVSLSYDKSQSVFEKTIDMDGIDSQSQYYDTDGIHSEIYRKYRLDKGFKSYLIDENGQILAINPTPKDLKSIFN